MDVVLSSEAIVFLLGAISIIQFLFAAYLVDTLRHAKQYQRKHARELFGLTKKLEGLTTADREKLLRKYDLLVQNIMMQVPNMVTEKAGSMIFELESQILKRLAELEPQLKEDEDAKKKMHDLIEQMEALEQNLIQTTIESVQELMENNRQELMHEESSEEVATLAA